MRTHSSYQPESLTQTAEAGRDDAFHDRLYKEQTVRQSDTQTTSLHVFEYYKAIVDLADAQKYFSTIPDVRNGLTKLRNPRLSERAPGVSYEVKMNIAYLDKRDALAKD